MHNHNSPCYLLGFQEFLKHFLFLNKRKISLSTESCDTPVITCWSPHPLQGAQAWPPWPWCLDVVGKKAWNISEFTTLWLLLTSGWINIFQTYNNLWVFGSYSFYRGNIIIKRCWSLNITQDIIWIGTKAGETRRGGSRWWQTLHQLAQSP